MGSFQLIGHVIAANLLTVLFLWGAWTAKKAEEKTGTPSGIPTSALLAMAAPLIVMGLAGYLGIIAE